MAQKNFKKNAAEMFITAPEGQPEPAPATQDSFTAPKGYQLIKEYKTERMQIMLRPETKKAVKKAAAAQGLSMNELINQILEEWIEGQGK